MEDIEKLNEREVWKTLIEVLIHLDELEKRVQYLEWTSVEKEVNAKKDELLKNVQYFEKED